MILIAILVVVIAGFVLWDRMAPVSSTPDMRVVWTGAILAVVGLVTSLLAWWLVVPVLALLAGAALIVIGRHRTAPSPGTPA
jgi:hypothetical protein